MYYKSGLKFLRDFPFSLIPELLGWDNPDDAKMKKRYRDVMNRYRKEYWEAVNMGITVEELKTLGVEMPDPELQAAGVGASGGGGFNIIPILTPRTPNLPPPNPEAIRQVEVKIQAINDAEERRANPPEPPEIPNAPTPNQPTRPQDPNAPQRPPAQSRLDEILEKYKDNGVEISDADWDEVEKVLDEELKDFKKNLNIDLSNVDTSLEDEVEEELERILTNTRGVSTGVNSSVTLAVIENLLAETTKGIVRLNKPKNYKKFLKNAKAFQLKGEKNKRKLGVQGRDIIRRLWKENPKLWQDILDILVKYGKVKKSDLSFQAKDYNRINELSDRLFNNTGIDSERLNREIMKRLKKEAIQRNAPQWYIDIFDDTPMDVRVDDPPMPPSIKDDTILRVLVRSMRQELIKLGIPEFDAQEMSLRLIEHFHQQEIENIAEAGDYTEGVNRTINVLLDEFNSVIRDATQRLTGPFTVNKRLLVKLMKDAFYTYLQEKNEKLTLLQKVQVFRDLVNQVVTKVGRESSSSSSEVGFQSISLSPKKLAEELVKEEKKDVVRGYNIRLRPTQAEGYGNQIYNIDEAFRPEVLLPDPRDFDNDGGDSDPDWDPEDYIPVYNPPDNFRNPFENPIGGDPDPPDDPPRGDMVNFYFRGAWRRISLRTLIKALIIAGATAGTIYDIYNRLSKQEEYNGKLNDDDDEENNQSDNIEDDTDNMPIEDQLADLRKQYLQLYQKYLDAQKRGGSKEELQSIFKQIMEVRDKIQKLKETMVDDDDGEDEQPVAPGGEEEEGETNGEVPVPPMGGDGDDPDTIVQFGDTDQSFAPDFVDPAEANLFLSTTKEAEEEKKRWARYSLVKPGFGLGSINQNPLAMHNFQAEKKRFTNCFKPEKPGKAPSKQAVERKWSPQMAPYWWPAIQNEYGDVQFEDSFYNNKMAQSFTNPVPVDNKRSTWENPNSIYHPENSLNTYKPHPVRIPELRNRAGYYGVNKPPSTQGGFTNNRKVYDDMYHYTPLMSSDYQHKKRDVSNDISYSLPRNGSARFT